MVTLNKLFTILWHMIEVYFDWMMLATRLKGEMMAGLGLKGMVDAYRSEWRRWQGTGDVDASTDGSITTVMDHIWKEKQKQGLIFMWGVRAAGHPVWHTPRLWERVCALLQQQLWHQCVQNLRTGPLSIPKTQKKSKKKDSTWSDWKGINGFTPQPGCLIQW